jgi:hypothetical protein
MTTKKRIVDLGLRIAEWVDYQWIPQSTIHNPQSAIRNPQSAIRNPLCNYFKIHYSLLPHPYHHHQIVHLYYQVPTHLVLKFDS